MLGPGLCGPPTRAPLLPKLRGHFAEFLDNASPAGLGILSLSTCVGLRYGRNMNHSGFSRQPVRTLRYYISLHLTPPGPRRGFACGAPPALVPGPPSPVCASRLCPHSSVILRYRNISLLPIGYASRPRLRTRLTQGRSALPWKPRISGHKDSHLVLATHSGILPSRKSTAPHGTASSLRECSPTDPFRDPRASVACFSPGHFRRRTSRPVSCYALFQWMAASGPTSWLSSKSHILFHLTCTPGPWPRVWALSLLTARLISRGLTPVRHLRGIRSLISLSKL